MSCGSAYHVSFPQVLNNTPAVIEQALERAWHAEKIAADKLAAATAGNSVLSLSSWMGALGLADTPVEVHPWRRDWSPAVPIFY
jgi:hypothetical protein